MLSMLQGCIPNNGNDENKFSGMWKLDRIEALDSATGRWNHDTPYAEYDGYILYDGDGHMAVHLIPNRYSEFDTNKNIDSLTSEELKELTKFYQSNFVYVADYTITGNSIAHTRLTATEPKNWNTLLTRDFEFKQDTLLLTSHESILGKKLRLKWVKV